MNLLELFAGSRSVGRDAYNTNIVVVFSWLLLTVSNHLINLKLK